MSQRQVSHTPLYFPNIQYLKCSRFHPEPLTRLRHFDSQVPQLLYNHSLQECDAFNAVNILHYHKCRYFLTLSLRLKEDDAKDNSVTAFKYLCYYFYSIHLQSTAMLPFWIPIAVSDWSKLIGVVYNFLD